MLLSREDERFVVTYALRLIAIFPKPGWFKEAVKARRHEGMKAAGIHGYQGTPWSGELDGKGLHGAA